jgi:hypothetical protein
MVANVFVKQDSHHMQTLRLARGITKIFFFFVRLTVSLKLMVVKSGKCNGMMRGTGGSRGR